MKEICIINYESNASIYGIGSYINEYVHCLLKIGCKVNLIALGTDKVHQEVYIKEQAGIRTIHIPYVQSRDYAIYNKSVCRILRLYLKDSKKLFFHFHYQQSNSLLEYLKQYFPLSKSVLTIHYLYWSARLNGDLSKYECIIRNKNHIHIKNKYQDVVDNYELERKFMQAVEQIICLSDDTYSLLIEMYHLDSRKLAIIPNGLTSRRYSFITKGKSGVREKLHIGKEEKIILFVGRISPIKGVYPLMAAFVKILEREPACRLVLVGDGDFNGVMKCGSHIMAKVTFTGRLDKEELLQWYQIADMGIFPSYYEECSYVGIEMLMHGLPIVASDGYAVRNMFNDENAVIASIGTYDKPEYFISEISEKVLALLHSEQQLVLKSTQSLQSYNKTYKLRYMQKKYDALFLGFSN